MIGNIPDGWKVEKLERLAKIQAGGTPSRAKMEYWNGDIPWIKISNIKSKYTTKSTEFITDEGLNNSSTKLFKVDTILYTIFATIGEVSILKIEAATNQAISGISEIDKKVNLYYLYNYLKSIKEKVINSGRGVAQNNINLAMLRSFEIPIPPLAQQEKIVKVLDISSALIEKQKGLILNYDLFLKSKFTEMFGDPYKNKMKWTVVNVDSVCEEIVDCINRTAPLVEYETEYKMVRTTNVRNHKIIFNDTRYVEEDIYNKWVRRLVPKKNDVIFTREAPVGEAGVITTNEKLFLGQRTMLFRPNYNKLNSYYLLYELMGSKVNAQINKISSGSTVKHLSVPHCKKFQINLPPIALQNKFASIVEQIESIKTKETQKLDHLETLHKSLMDKAFKGDI